MAGADLGRVARCHWCHVMHTSRLRSRDGGVKKGAVVAIKGEREERQRRRRAVKSERLCPQKKGLCGERLYTASEVGTLLPITLTRDHCPVDDLRRRGAVLKRLVLP